MFVWEWDSWVDFQSGLLLPEGRKGLAWWASGRQELGKSCSVTAGGLLGQEFSREWD